ncbi:hypothetical protein, conserved [Plasmodium gonderi]|uniref:Uncharacterized protein n=1 Tax=Plasmodium gonderi TaxID=77519 RepID=A0A1Y1JFP6_PLAGO|nr:hypothetical protein, conserved [Plasmodium gonderi]GAW79263.1 hypothetical protein, conserved [Plasmodium gonderi]
MNKLSKGNIFCFFISVKYFSFFKKNRILYYLQHGTSCGMVRSQGTHLPVFSYGRRKKEEKNATVISMTCSASIIARKSNIFDYIPCVGKKRGVLNFSSFSQNGKGGNINSYSLEKNKNGGNQDCDTMKYENGNPDDDYKKGVRTGKNVPNNNLSDVQGEGNDNLSDVQGEGNDNLSDVQGEGNDNLSDVQGEGNDNLSDVQGEGNDSKDILEEDDQDDDNKYAKSFYEIYDDNGDTHDCPQELLKFIRKEHMNIQIKIKCSSPRNLKKTDVQNVINDMFQEEGVEERPIEKGKERHIKSGQEAEEDNPEIYYLNSNFKKFNYPDRNVLWPNPLVYNHRLQPFVLEKKKNEDNVTFEIDKKHIEINKNRLQNLWCYSSSYGVDWNTLDALFLNYKNKKEEHLNEWEMNKNKIMLYASKVAKRKLIKSRKQLLDNLGIDYSNNIYANYDDIHEVNSIDVDDEQMTEYNLLFPRSIFRNWTRTLYFYWKDRYMHYYEDTLCDYLKGEVVDLQLLREQNERNLNLSKKKMMREHSFRLKPIKGSNLYVTRYVPKGRKKAKVNVDHFDLTGVGENIYDTAQKEN